MADLFVAPTRLERWTENFAARHGATTLRVADGALLGTADDGSTFRALPPFGSAYEGGPTIDGLVAAASPPADWGLLLVRKGGFAMARLRGDRVVASKVGQRHVQGRTKAGGQSQQRFARRRDNQARIAYEAAAGHATRILAGVPVLVTGGDRVGVREVLQISRLGPAVAELPDVREPRRDVLDEAVLAALSARVSVVNA